MATALTERAGNPAHGLRAAYADLMAIPDARELSERALSLVRSYEGRGCSRETVRKFATRIGQHERRGLTAVRKFVTDWLLAADGLRVVGSAA